MKILIIHNNYSQKGGEETVVAFQQKILEEKGHQVYVYTRDYNEIKRWWLGRIGGTFSSIYNPRSIRDLKKIISMFQPEVAILHNLFPIISPAVIPFLKKRGVKTVQILHNYRLLCPIGTFFTNEKICEKCTTKGREWHCLLNRCNGGFLQSLGFAKRSMIVRKLNYFGAVEQFVALSDFQKNKLVSNDFDEFRIAVIPNSLPWNVEKGVNAGKRDFIGFVGRLTREKGIFDFIELAHLMPNYEFRVAGNQTPILNDENIPQNLKFEGFLDASQLRDFYAHAKVIVFPSRWYEGFPMTLLEAFCSKTPVITYNLSVMPEVVEDGEEGFVIEVGDLQTMSEKIKLLFRDEQIWTALSENVLRKYKREYSVQSYYDKLISKCKNNETHKILEKN